MDFTVSNIVKLAKASDPRTSSFAVYHDKNGKLFIWGMVDQGNTYHEFVNLDCSGGWSRPGVFQAHVVGVGHIVILRELEKLAELKQDLLIGGSTNVLRNGPVLEKLKPGISAFIAEVRKKVGDDKLFKDWQTELSRDWLSSFCRILLRVQNFHHGGAILITPDSKDLNLKYQINYRRLNLEMQSLCHAQIKNSAASNELMEIVQRHEESVPADRYLDENISDGDKEDCEKALASIIWFISLLTRVDGCVLLNPNLEVRAFGVEIITDERPKDVFISKTAKPSLRNLRRIDYNHFGTRHRSMMRYCAKFPNSVGFVISQDGDVRAITKVGDKLIMWDNVRLQLHDWLD